MSSLKRCNVCLSDKPLLEFNRLSRAPDGLSYTCRQCSKKKQNAYYQQAKTTGTAWWQRNVERHRQLARESARRTATRKSEYDRAYRERNRDRVRAADAVRYASNPEKYRAMSKRTRDKRTLWDKRDIDLRCRYGVGMAWWEHQFELQNGLCALCSEPLNTNEPSKRTVLDHCHSTGKPRAILHNKCNVALGLYESARGKFESYLLKYGDLVEVVA